MLIKTSRFQIRPIILSDANENYLSWFKDKKNIVHINTANEIGELDSLISYVKSKINREDILFLAIIHSETLKHIGNIKFDPLEFDHQRTFLGIFIGDEHWRGKGVFGEIFPPIYEHLKRIGIEKVYLGVKDYNVSAYNAYLKAGFVVTNSGLVQGENGIELCFSTSL